MKTPLAILKLENCIDELKACKQYPSVKNRIEDYEIAINILKQANALKTSTKSVEVCKKCNDTGRCYGVVFGGDVKEKKCECLQTKA